MTDYEGVGVVSTDGEKSIRWTLPRYMEESQEVDTVMCSPYFTFRGEKECSLGAYPNGDISDNTVGWMGIDCGIPSLPLDTIVTCSMLDSRGREILQTGTENKGDRWYSQFKWIRRTDMVRRREEILPGGTLRILCRVVVPGEGGRTVEDAESVAEVAQSNSGACSSSGSQTHNSEGAKRDVTNTAETPFSDSSSHIHKGLNTLSQLWKDHYVQSKNCDFIIRVKGREFRVHRLVLMVRVPAFDAMLTHDTVENTEGVVSIEDCDPGVFNEFLLFVYSGKVENLLPDNMCGLYVLADKYCLQDLKEMCLDFMRNAVSVETICDVVTLATMHGEPELLKIATEFFVQNSEEILETVKWQVFLKENPTKGNELLLKTVKFFKKQLVSK